MFSIWISPENKPTGKKTTNYKILASLFAPRPRQSLSDIVMGGSCQETNGMEPNIATFTLNNGYHLAQGNLFVMPQFT